MKKWILALLAITLPTVFWFMSVKVNFREIDSKALEKLGFTVGDESVEISSWSENIDNRITDRDLPLFGMQGQGKSFWSWSFDGGLGPFNFDDEEVEAGLAIWSWNSQLYISVYHENEAFIEKVSAFKRVGPLLDRGLEILNASSPKEHSRSNRQITIGPRISGSDVEEGGWTEIRRGVENIPPPSTE